MAPHQLIMEPPTFNLNREYSSYGFPPPPFPHHHLPPHRYANHMDIYATLANCRPPSPPTSGPYSSQHDISFLQNYVPPPRQEIIILPDPNIPPAPPLMQYFPGPGPYARENYEPMISPPPPSPPPPSPRPLSPPPLSPTSLQETLINEYPVNRNNQNSRVRQDHIAAVDNTTCMLYNLNMKMLPAITPASPPRPRFQVDGRGNEIDVLREQELQNHIAYSRPQRCDAPNSAPVAHQYDGQKTHNAARMPKPLLATSRSRGRAANAAIPKAKPASQPPRSQPPRSQQPRSQPPRSQPPRSQQPRSQPPRSQPPRSQPRREQYRAPPKSPPSPPPPYLVVVPNWPPMTTEPDSSVPLDMVGVR